MNLSWLQKWHAIKLVVLKFHLHFMFLSCCEVNIKHQKVQNPNLHCFQFESILKVLAFTLSAFQLLDLVSLNNTVLFSKIYWTKLRTEVMFKGIAQIKILQWYGKVEICNCYIEFPSSMWYNVYAFREQNVAKSSSCSVLKRPETHRVF